MSKTEPEYSFRACTYLDQVSGRDRPSHNLTVARDRADHVVLSNAQGRFVVRKPSPGRRPLPCPAAVIVSSNSSSAFGGRAVTANPATTAGESEIYFYYYQREQSR